MFVVLTLVDLVVMVMALVSFLTLFTVFLVVIGMVALPPSGLVTVALVSGGSWHEVSLRLDVGGDGHRGDRGDILGLDVSTTPNAHQFSSNACLKQ